MSGRLLLDTNICIYIHRQKQPAVMARFQQMRPGDAAVSVVTFGELMFGAEKSQQRALVLQRLRRFVELVPVLPLPESAAEHYGAIRAVLEAKGQPIGGNDLWIAAHARAIGATVVTNDDREFSRVPGLKVENWTRPAT
jgi:tRNA(fMet)-specific endonuclease VapC